MYKLDGDYVWTTKTPLYLTKNRFLSIGGQLKLQEYVGNRQFIEIGLPYNKLLALGFTFVLTKTASEIFKMPRSEQEIIIKTAHMGIKGSRFFRYYIFENKKGERLIESISEFVLIDLLKHKVLKPTVFTDICEAKELPAPRLTCKNPEKIFDSESMDYKGRLCVGHKAIDYNNHLNNSVYGEYIEYFYGSIAARRKRFTINFLKEGLKGDQMEIYGKTSSNQAIITGKHERGECFIAKIEN